MFKVPKEISQQIYTPEVRAKMSAKRKEYYARLTPEQRKELNEKISAGKIRKTNELISEIETLKAELAKYKTD